MELRDALSVTVLGMSVVFGGLSLTALLIITMNRIPDLATRLRRSVSPPEAQHSPVSVEPPLDPEIVTVIATVLEVERRLHRAERGGRLTISRRI